MLHKLRAYPRIGLCTFTPAQAQYRATHPPLTLLTTTTTPPPPPGSELQIHRKYDLKGSTVGRVTSNPSKLEDPNTILKDLDLDVVFKLEEGWHDRWGRGATVTRPAGGMNARVCVLSSHLWDRWGWWDVMQWCACVCGSGGRLRTAHGEGVATLGGCAAAQPAA